MTTNFTDVLPAPAVDGSLSSPTVETSRHAPRWPTPGRYVQRLSRVPLRWWVLGWVIVTVAVGWLTRWVVDDAFIAYEYAHNLAGNAGFTWSGGPPVEGYTDFLWIVMLAGADRSGVDLVVASHILSISSAVVVLVATAAMARTVFGASNGYAHVSVLLLATNYTFLAFTTSGLETMTQTAAVMVVWALASPGFTTYEPPDLRRCLAVSAVATAGVMLHPDTALLVAVPMAAMLWGCVRGPARSWIRVAGLLAPAALTLGTWTSWRLHEYSTIVPNTATAKSHGSADLRLGVVYLLAFVVVSGTVAFVASFVIHRRELLVQPWVRLAGATLVLWSLYVVSVGGDHMWYRFMVPAIPLLCLVAAGVLAVTRTVAARATLVGVIAVTAVWQMTNPPLLFAQNTPVAMDEFVASVEEFGERIGVDLGSDTSAVPCDSDAPVIAVPAAGAIVNRSNLCGVDMLGLIDPWTARHGVPLNPGNPVRGHARIATPRHLVGEGVNLVTSGDYRIDPPPVGRAPAADIVPGLWWNSEVVWDGLPPGTTVVFAPIGDSWSPMLYIRNHRRVDALVSDGTWQQRPLPEEPD